MWQMQVPHMQVTLEFQNINFDFLLFPLCVKRNNKYVSLHSQFI